MLLRELSVWAELVGLVEHAIVGVGGALGGTGVGILATTFAVRAALIPIMLPAAARSQARRRVERRIRPEIKRIHRDYKDDPAGLTRELRAIHSANGISMIDGAGLLASFIQLPVLIAFFQAVLNLSEGAALASGGLVPGLAAGAVSAFGTRLSGQSAETPWMFWIAAILPVAISAWLGAGIGLYLLGFYGAALIQSELMRRRISSSALDSDETL